MLPARDAFQRVRCFYCVTNTFRVLPDFPFKSFLLKSQKDCLGKVNLHPFGQRGQTCKTQVTLSEFKDIDSNVAVGVTAQSDIISISCYKKSFLHTSCHLISFS